MTCFAPLTAWYSKEIGATGKRGITFDRGSSFSGVPLRLPCGRCVGCRLERSRQWAMRCLHENKFHKDSCFVTLTYSNECLPEFGNLVKRDFQLFMKRLRKLKGDRIRFYACGEYGELNKRPHYHALLFNCLFADRLRHSESGRGDVLYTSKELSGLWPFGHHLIGSVTFESAAYVARYVMKKVTGDQAAAHYEVMDSDGVLHQRIPEFTLMSRRPGIGTNYYEKYGAEVYAHDSVVVNGHEVRPPRFYDNLFGETCPERLAVLKLARVKKARLFRADTTPDRMRVREVVQLRKLQQLKRGV